MNDSQRTEQLLAQLGIGSEKIRVLGNGAQITVICIGLETSSKWILALQKVFAGYKVKAAPYTFNAATNKATQLSPTKRSGFIVTACAA